VNDASCMVVLGEAAVVGCGSKELVEEWPVWIVAKLSTFSVKVNQAKRGTHQTYIVDSSEYFESTISYRLIFETRF
jgi:hypothetical protein